MSNTDDYYLSNSALKEFEKDDACRTKWRHKWIIGDIPGDPPSEAMIKGLYFETLAIGSSAKSDELPDVSFLRTAKGEPKVELVRIEEQAQRFKDLFDPNHPDFLGFTIKDSQVTMYDDELKIKGTFDFDAVDEFESECLFDIKFTSDVTNSYGDYSWGRDPYEINWRQQVLYKDLYQNSYGKAPKMYVIVFDSSPKKGIKLFKLNISDTAVREVLDQFGDAWAHIGKYNENGWPVKPTESNCETCPLKCEARYVKPAIDIVNVSIR